ncbi:TPA: hypothetical protein ACH3X2_007278 [Trebouxia sp. C0005]
MHANMSQGNILSQFGRLADNPGKATFSICSPKSLAQESAYLSSQHVQHSRGEDKDAIAKCESGFGAALRGGVWGAEWVAYGAKYALVHSYGLVDKTVASGGCRHDTSPGFDKRQQTRKGWLEYKQIPPLGFKAATHSTGRQVHQDPIKRTTMPEQQDQATESLIKARS